MEAFAPSVGTAVGGPFLLAAGSRFLLRESFLVGCRLRYLSRRQESTRCLFLLRLLSSRHPCPRVLSLL